MPDGANGPRSIICSRRCSLNGETRVGRARLGPPGALGQRPDDPPEPLLKLISCHVWRASPCETAGRTCVARCPRRAPQARQRELRPPLAAPAQHRRFVLAVATIPRRDCTLTGRQARARREAFRRLGDVQICQSSWGQRRRLRRSALRLCRVGEGEGRRAIFGPLSPAFPGSARHVAAGLGRRTPPAFGNRGRLVFRTS